MAKRPRGWRCCALVCSPLVMIGWGSCRVLLLAAGCDHGTALLPLSQTSRPRLASQNQVTAWKTAGKRLISPWVHATDTRRTICIRHRDSMRPCISQHSSQHAMRTTAAQGARTARSRDHRETTYLARLPSASKATVRIGYYSVRMR